MDFQPSDYLSNLNLVFDGASVSPEENISPADFDLFAQSEFFDLDVFKGKKEKTQESFAQKDSFQKDSFQNYVKAEPSEGVREMPTPAFSEDSDSASEAKRKRNTAASARFRIKKKLKEQQMEQHVRELQERVSSLEQQLKTVEMENKCLKQVIYEKNESKTTDLLERIKQRSLAGSQQQSSYTFTA